MPVALSWRRSLPDEPDRCSSRSEPCATDVTEESLLSCPPFWRPLTAASAAEFTGCVSTSSLGSSHSTPAGPKHRLCGLPNTQRPQHAILDHFGELTTSLAPLMLFGPLGYAALISSHCNTLFQVSARWQALYRRLTVSKRSWVRGRSCVRSEGCQRCEDAAGQAAG